jgi:hypothetical protein
LHEVDLLSMRYRLVQERADRRAALPAWLLANVNRDTDVRHEPFTLEEIVSWLGHGFQREEMPPPPVQTNMEEVRQTVLMLQQVYTNGQLDGR